MPIFYKFLNTNYTKLFVVENHSSSKIVLIYQRMYFRIIICIFMFFRIGLTFLSNLSVLTLFCRLGTMNSDSTVVSTSISLFSLFPISYSFGLFEVKGTELVRIQVGWNALKQKWKNEKDFFLQFNIISLNLDTLIKMILQ